MEHVTFSFPASEQLSRHVCVRKTNQYVIVVTRLSMSITFIEFGNRNEFNIQAILKKVFIKILFSNKKIT